MALFNAQKSNSTTLYDTAAQQVVTLIGSGTVCEGNLRAEGSTRIDGEIRGDVEVKGSLIVGSTGKIEGNAKADNVFLAGEIHGDIDSTEGKTEISDTGKVIGDIKTKSIVIDENALFDGKCSMTSRNEKEKNEASKENSDKNQTNKDPK